MKIGRMLIVLIIPMLLMLPQSVLAAVRDDPTAPSPWAVEQLKLARHAGLIPDELSTFYTMEATRSEFVVCELNLYTKVKGDIQPAPENSFSDISGDSHGEEILKAYAAGFAEGYDDGTFRPDEHFTREEAAVMLVKLLKALDPEQSAEPSRTYDFSDSSQISREALPAVTFCYEKEIMWGIANLTIAPKKDISRQEAFVMVYRLALEAGFVNALNEDETKDLKVKPNIVNGQDNETAFDESFRGEGAQLLDSLKEQVDFDFMGVYSDRLELQTGNAYFTAVNSEESFILSAYTKDLADENFKKALEILEAFTSCKDELKVLLDGELEEAMKSNRLEFEKVIVNKVYAAGRTYEFADGSRKFTVDIMETYNTMHGYKFPYMSQICPAQV